jgi:hypothetical protein
MTSLQTLEFDGAALSAAIAAVDLARIDRPTCDELSLAFGREADSWADLNAPLKFLAIICSWRLRPDEEEAPFEPVWRPVTLDDLTDAQLSAMASVAESVADPELRARLCDLLWMRRRRHDLARLAAEDYLASAERLVRSRHMIGMKERLHRAVQLAAMLGRSQELFSRIVDGIMRLAQTPDLPHAAVAECLRVFRTERCGARVSLYNLALARAQSIAANERNPLWERTFWEFAADFARYSDDQASSRTARMNAALTYEREAQAAPRQAVAAHFWRMALRTYRAIPDTEDARRRVHERLLNAQQQIPKEMVRLHTESIDISDYVARSRDRNAAWKMSPNCPHTKATATRREKQKAASL